MRSVVTSGALVALLFVSHAALAADAKTVASSDAKDTHAAATTTHKSKKAHAKKSGKATTKVEAKIEAKGATKPEAKLDTKSDAKSDAKDASKAIAKLDKQDKAADKKAPKVFSKGTGADDDSDLVAGLDPKIAAEDTQEIAEEQASRARVLAAAKAIQERTKRTVIAAAPQEQVHVDDAMAQLEAMAKDDPKGESKPETKDDAKALVAAKAHDDGPITGKLVKSSTHSKLHAAPKPPCLRPEVTITSHLSEEDHFALTRCDGSLAPGAVEHFSIVTRPGSASRPELGDIGKMEKSSGDTIAPGVRRMDPALVERFQAVVDHFSKQGKTPHVDVVSGFRPSSVGSLHASGRAMDFRLEGVRNEELVAFCKTLTDTGCGYYPNSVFVHMDVRDPGAGHVTWIDASGPGEKPHYVSAWPAPPAETVHPRSTDEGFARLDPTMPSLPVDEHPTAPIAAPPTWGVSTQAAIKDIAAHAGGVEGIADDETP